MQLYPHTIFRFRCLIWWILRTIVIHWVENFQINLSGCCCCLWCISQDIEFKQTLDFVKWCCWWFRIMFLHQLFLTSMKFIFNMRCILVYIYGDDISVNGTTHCMFALKTVEMGLSPESLVKHDVYSSIARSILCRFFEHTTIDYLLYYFY